MIEITMPRLSDTMEEGAIATWHKKPGDAVEIGDILVEIETDKATMDYEAYEAGTLSKILVQEGENVSIGTPIALIDDGKGDSSASSGTDDSSAKDAPDEAGDEADKDEDSESADEPDETGDEDEVSEGAEESDESEKAETSKKESAEDEEDEEAAAESDESGPSVRDGRGATSSGQAASSGTEEPAGERQFASPLVRKLAREHQFDLSAVKGSGPGGRIIRADIEHLLEGGPSVRDGRRATSSGQATSSGTGVDEKEAEKAEAKVQPKQAASADEKRASESVPMTQTRRVIAKRLGESSRSIPHFYVTAVADAEALMQLRGELNEQLIAGNRPKVSVNDLLIRASALALREHPLVNASYVDDTSTTMLVHRRINVGVAVASKNGLVVPVIEDADQKTVTQLGIEAKQLVSLANAKKLTPAQMSGGTFTISNLGMFGVEEFTAIINPPEGAILAVGGTKREPAVVGDEIVPRYRMRYTLSADHRVIDGALAAQFLQTLTRLIESPWTIIA